MQSLEKYSSSSSALRYLELSDVMNLLSSHQKILLSCGLCKGIVFEPIQCGKCKKLYCGPHAKQIRKCLECQQSAWIDTFNISRQLRDKLLDIQLKCYCRSSIFRYTEYIQHLNKCPSSNQRLKNGGKYMPQVKEEEYKYKTIYVVKDNSKVALKYPQAIYLNIAMRNGDKKFDYQLFSYDLVNMMRNGFSYEKQRNVSEKIECQVSKLHQPRSYWTVFLESNPYELYGEQNQNLMQAAYKQYQRNNDKSRFQILNKGQKYIINFSTMIQINPNSSYSRNIKRFVI